MGNRKTENIETAGKDTILEDIKNKLFGDAYYPDLERGAALEAIGEAMSFLEYGIVSEHKVYEFGDSERKGLAAIFGIFGRYTETVLNKSYIHFMLENKAGPSA